MLRKTPKDRGRSLRLVPAGGSAGAINSILEMTCELSPGRFQICRLSAALVELPNECFAEWYWASILAFIGSEREGVVMIWSEVV